MEKLSLFLKPWMDWDITKLIKKLKEYKISEVELPLRAGLLINPDNCEEELPKLQRRFSDEGIKIKTVGIFVIDERIFSAMNKSGIELARIMFSFSSDEKYPDAEKRYIDMLNEAAEYCRKYNTKVGIQPHNGSWLSTVMELKHILEKCDTRYIGAIWDLGHAGLAGEIPKKSLDIIFDNLFLVNFKSAYWISSEDNENMYSYRPYYTTGDKCMCSWKESVEYLKKLGYKGGFCIHSEYTNPGDFDKDTNGEESESYLKKDLELLKAIL